MRGISVILCFILLLGGVPVLEPTHYWNVEFYPTEVIAGGYFIIILNITKRDCPRTLESMNITLKLPSILQPAHWLEEYLLYKDATKKLYFYPVIGVDQFTLKIRVFVPINATGGTYTVTISGKGAERTPEGDVVLVEFEKSQQIRIKPYSVWHSVKLTPNTVTPGDKLRLKVTVINDEFPQPKKNLTDFKVNITIPHLNKTIIKNRSMFFYGGKFSYSTDIAVPRDIEGGIHRVYVTISFIVDNRTFIYRYTPTFVVEKPPQLEVTIYAPLTVKNHTEINITLSVFNKAEYPALNATAYIKVGRESSSIKLGKIEPLSEEAYNVRIKVEARAKERVYVRVTYFIENIPVPKYVEDEIDIMVEPTLVDKLSISKIVMATLLITGMLAGWFLLKRLRFKAG